MTAKLCSPADRDLLRLWKTWPLRERVIVNALFKLLKDGRTVGGHRAHPVVSTIDNSTIIHPSLGPV